MKKLFIGFVVVFTGLIASSFEQVQEFDTKIVFDDKTEYSVKGTDLNYDNGLEDFQENRIAARMHQVTLVESRFALGQG